MRFIIHEQPTERLLAAGELRYKQGDVPTGAVEKWRLTEAAAGFRFLRVDLDARAAESGNTYLYHALLDEHGRFQRLKFRFWGQVNDQPLQITGDAVFDDATLTAYRTVNGRTYEQVLDLPALYAFWFPATMGLNFLPLETASLHTVFAISLDPASQDPAAVFSLFTTNLQAAPLADGAVRYCWADQERTLWRDENGFITQMQRGDGLTAVARHIIRYQGNE